MRFDLEKLRLCENIVYKLFLLGKDSFVLCFKFLDSFFNFELSKSDYLINKLILKNIFSIMKRLRIFLLTL